jgi:hypothetical protein
MIAPNLLLKFKIEGDNRVHIRGAARIKVDGCGALMLYGTEDGTAESVSLGCIQCLSIDKIHSVPNVTAVTIH